MVVLRYNDYNILNESFKSSKLKDIINQHGMPKYEGDNRFLYDLQDDEIYGVMSYDEWDKYHMKNDHSFYIILEDDSLLVISNIDKFRYIFTDDDFQKEFKRRRDERHPGNEFNDIPKHLRKDALVDDTTKHFKQKVEELEHRRNIESFKEKAGDEIHNLPGVVRTYMKDYFDENVGQILSDHKDTPVNDLDCEFEINFCDETYIVNVEYNLYSSDGYEKYGAEYFDVSIEVNNVEIYDENGTDDVFDIKELVDESDLGDLFDTYRMEDVEGNTTNYYTYYGVKPSDFF